MVVLVRAIKKLLEAMFLPYIQFVVRKMLILNVEVFMFSKS